jgi:hypothetical protein
MVPSVDPPRRLNAGKGAVCIAVLGLTAISLIPVEETSWGYRCPNGMTISALRPVTVLEAILGAKAFKVLLWDPERPEC